MFYEKESFWMALLAILIPILNHFLGWGLEISTIAVIVIPLIALIIGDKWESVKVAEAEARIEIVAIEAGLYETKE